VEAGAVAFSDDGCAIATAALARRAMEYASMFEVPIIEHAEEPTLVPPGGSMNEGKYSTRLGLGGMPTVAEDVIVARDILLAEYTGAHLHVAHISSAASIELVRRAKARGLKVSCEVTPHHFTLTDAAVVDYDANTKMNPPLRSQRDVDAVHEGLQDGTIDAIATDHAPHAPEEKDVEYQAAPFGIIGLETALGLIVSKLVKTGVLSLAEAIAKVVVQPRRILRLPPVALEEGQMANLTMFSPERRWTVTEQSIYSKCRNTPFKGWELTGSVYGVYNKRRLWLMMPGKIFLVKGAGKHKEKLTSFEMALRDAGIAEFNLVRVSSIFPPHCKIISRVEGQKFLRPGQILHVVISQCETNEAHRLIAASVGIAIPRDRNAYGYLSEHHAYGQKEDYAGDYAEDLAASMLATILGVEFDPDASWDKKKEQWKISDKIVSTRSITQTAIGDKNGLWTTVIAGAVLII